MARQNFPEPGTRVHVTTTTGVEYTGVCKYHLSAQWVLTVEDSPWDQDVAIHNNDHWERLT